MNILTIDAGTSSMRGILYRDHGGILFKIQKGYALTIIDDQHVEFDARILSDTLFLIASAVSDFCKANDYELNAVSVTAQRSSVVPVDEAGNPLRPILSWQDKRAVSVCEEKNIQAEKIYGLCGMRAATIYSAPKMLWLKRNEREVYRRAYKLIGIHEYLLYLLTSVFITDHSIASRTCLLDVSRLEWSQKLLDLFEIDVEKLCGMVSPGSICGHVTSSFENACGIPEGTPVVTAGGDQQCGALGLGVMEDGQVEITSGTGSYIVAVSGAPVFDPQMRVICNVAAEKGKWIVEGSTFSSGLVFDWMNRQFFNIPGQSYPHEQIDSECAASPAGANGLIMIPSFGGKGAPYWDPYGRGCFQNIGFHNSRGDFARATLEGISGEMLDCLTVVLELIKTDIKKISCSGGLTKSELFNQIQADTYGLPIVCYKNEEATSLGAWMQAAKALGQYKTLNQAFSDTVDMATARHFRPDDARHELYARINQCRRIFYESADYKKIRGILKEPDSK